MPQTSLLEWSNSIRLTMATDSGRKLFQEQVQTHGFLFLDDYLDNILYRAKQDPLIELVKTPGRKKVIARKPKLASKLANTMDLAAEVEPDGGMDTSVHMNDFHKRLLGVKVPSTSELEVYDENITGHTPIIGDSQKTVRVSPSDNDASTSSLVNENATPAPTYFAPSAVLEESQPPSSSVLESNHIDPSELSVIAEDDESPEHTRISAQFKQIPLKSPPVVPREPEATAKDKQADVLNTERDKNDSQTEIYSSRTNSSRQLPSLQNEPAVSNAPVQISSIEVPLGDRYMQNTLNSHTAPLPQVLKLHPDQALHANAITAPLPKVSSSNDVLRHEEQTSVQDSHPSLHPTRASSQLYPTLPEPAPLHKSMKVSRGPSVDTATPGIAVAGKRTSWLIKSREVKALEGAGKKHHIAGGSGDGTELASGSSSNNYLKRKSSDLVVIPKTTGLEEEERNHKIAKNDVGDVASLKPKTLLEADEDPARLVEPRNQDLPQNSLSSFSQDGVLDRLRKKVEGLGARVGISVGKSLGGNAVNALAEARAAAEARVAERHHKEDEITLAFKKALVDSTPPSSTEEAIGLPLEGSERRLSVSDLFPADGKVKQKHKAPEKLFQFAPSSHPLKDVDRESISTTPPNSPPTAQSSSFILPTGPVFVPPAPTRKSSNAKPTLGLAFQMLPASTISQHHATGLSLSPHLSPQSSSRAPAPVPLTAQSTLESVKSDTIFDDREDIPAWMPNTQDTEYSGELGSQTPATHGQVELVDEDDSWPIDEKLAAGVQWTFGGGMSKEDSMTWSTLPSQSQRADTGPTRDSPAREDMEPSRNIPGAFDMDNDADAEEEQNLIPNDSELEELVMGKGKSTISLIEAKSSSNQSAMSMASSASSQSQGGLLGQASKLLNSALGTSKKGKPEVKKVLQMAAVAAKKQQEEADKKAARMKEMENRRQLAQHRKAEEEKTRSLEQERKLKEEGDRRKREREDQTDKRPLKPSAGVKKDEEANKKRKIEKPELKKSSQNLSSKPSNIKSALKQPSTLASSSVYNSSLQVAGLSTSLVKAVDQQKTAKTAAALAQKSYSKVPAATKMVEDDVSQPSQVLQTQMAARAKAQIQAAKQGTEVPSESIELPDINSEYSDSDDEDRPKTFDPPEWAQSPELRQALKVQSTINPDDIFGSVRPLKMEEIFKTRTSRFRARTSSANWTGSDRLTLEEEREYAKRMGFR